MRLTFKQYIALWNAAICAWASRAKDDSASNFNDIVYAEKDRHKNEWYMSWNVGIHAFNA